MSGTIDIYRGNRRVIRDYIRDPDLDPVDLTGAVCTLTVRASKDGPIVIQKNTTDPSQAEIGSADQGEVFFYVESGDTQNLESAQYVFDVTVELAGADGPYTTNEGRINLIGPVGNTFVPGTSGPIVQGVQGPQGFQGFQGMWGFQGTQGMRGPQGFQGQVGAGVQGFQGNEGTQGFQGLQGVLGVQGLQGLQGFQGFQGFQGDSGVQGFQGSQGLQGLQGLQGNEGAQGFQGLQGVLGVQGFQGLQGFQGFQGFQGQGGQGVSIMFSFDGVGLALIPGLKVNMPVGQNCTILGWKLVANAAGSLTLDVRRTAWGSEPTALDSVCGGAKPTLSSSQFNKLEPVVGWSTGLSKDDIFQAHVDSCSGITRAILTVTVQKS